MNMLRSSRFACSTALVVSIEHLLSQRSSHPTISLKSAACHSDLSGQPASLTNRSYDVLHSLQDNSYSVPVHTRHTSHHVAIVGFINSADGVGAISSAENLRRMRFLSYCSESETIARSSFLCDSSRFLSER